MNRRSNNHNTLFLVPYYVIYVHNMFRPQGSLSIGFHCFVISKHLILVNMATLVSSETLIITYQSVRWRKVEDYSSILTTVVNSYLEQLPYRRLDSNLSNISKTLYLRVHNQKYKLFARFLSLSMSHYVVAEIWLREWHIKNLTLTSVKKERKKKDCQWIFESHLKTLLPWTSL
jgi:hypothetical protein